MENVYKKIQQTLIVVWPLVPILLLQLIIQKHYVINMDQVVNGMEWYVIP